MRDEHPHDTEDREEGALYPCQCGECPECINVTRQLLAAARQEIALREDDYNSLHKEYTIEVETLRQEIAELKAELARAGTGVLLISEERARQVDSEGWTERHDAQHDRGELAMAAACYLDPVGYLDPDGVPGRWPWAVKWWKPTPNDRVRELVKAGALVAAEIDRLRRLNDPAGGDE